MQNKYRYSLGLCSAVGEKGKKRGETGRHPLPIPDYRSARLPLLIYFSPFSATAEPGPRLLMLGFISPLPS